MKNRYDVAKFLHQPACGSQYRLWRLQVIDSVSQRSVSSRLIVCKKKKKKDCICNSWQQNELQWISSCISVCVPFCSCEDAENGYFTTFEAFTGHSSPAAWWTCTFTVHLFPSICPQILSSCQSMSSSTLLRLPCGWSWPCFQLTAPEVRGDEMDGAHGQTNAPAPTCQHVQPQQVSPQVWRR